MISIINDTKYLFHFCPHCHEIRMCLEVSIDDQNFWMCPECIQKLDPAEYSRIAKKQYDELDVIKWLPEFPKLRRFEKDML